MPQDYLKDELISINTCPITLEIFNDPASLECGHIFERGELKNLVHKSCPTCRAPIHTLTPPFYVKNTANLIQKLEKGEEIEIDDFRPLITCPVSRKIFYDPVSRACCGFTVERSMSNNCHECSCHQSYSKWIPALYTKNLIDLAIKFFPELQNERYFKMSYFVERLRKNDNRAELDKLCEILKSSNYLNAISEEKYFKGSSAVTQLLLFPEGFRRVIVDTALRKQITPEGFNAVLKEGFNKGESAVFILLCSDEGRDLLMRDKELRAKIMSVGLNTIPETANGVSAVFYLAKYCRPLLLEDQRICHLIDIGTLMHALHAGPNKGESAYQLLRETDDGKQILELLQDRIDEWLKPPTTVSIVASGVNLFPTAESEQKKRNSEDKRDDNVKKRKTHVSIPYLGF